MFILTIKHLFSISQIEHIFTGDHYFVICSQDHKPSLLNNRSVYVDFYYVHFLFLAFNP